MKILLFINMKISAISSLSVCGRTRGATCHGFCGFPSIDWHVIPDFIHPYCLDTTDAYRTGSPGPKSGRLES